MSKWNHIIEANRAQCIIRVDLYLLSMMELIAQPHIVHFIGLEMLTNKLKTAVPG